MPTNNRYALADYTLTVTIPNEMAREGKTSITIGGAGEGEGKFGSYVGSIQVKRNKDLWSTEGDATGSWVHNKDLNRTGSIDVEITQVSDQITQLVYLCSAYESVASNVAGLQLQIQNVASGSVIATGYDCYIAKIPDHPFQDTAQKLTFSFTCGRITYYD